MYLVYILDCIIFWAMRTLYEFVLGYAIMACVGVFTILLLLLSCGVSTWQSLTIIRKVCKPQIPGTR